MQGKAILIHAEKRHLLVGDLTWAYQIYAGITGKLMKGSTNCHELRNTIYEYLMDKAVAKAAMLDTHRGRLDIGAAGVYDTVIITGFLFKVLEGANWRSFEISKILRSFSIFTICSISRYGINLLVWKETSVWSLPKIYIKNISCIMYHQSKYQL